MRLFDARIDRQQAEIELEECQKQLAEEPRYFDDKKHQMNPLYVSLLQKISGLKLKIVGYENLRSQMEKEIISRKIPCIEGKGD